MLKLLADENLNNDIVRALLRRSPSLDIVRVQDVGLSGADDPTVLAWAAEHKRVLLTHDVTSLTCYAYQRIEREQEMPGVFEISRAVPMGQAIEDVLLLAECSLESEWEGQIRYLPCGEEAGRFPKSWRLRLRWSCAHNGRTEGRE